MAQSYGYKEPAAPVSIQRSAPGGGGVSISGHGGAPLDQDPGFPGEPSQGAGAGAQWYLADVCGAVLGFTLWLLRLTPAPWSSLPSLGGVDGSLFLEPKMPRGVLAFLIEVLLLPLPECPQPS